MCNARIREVDENILDIRPVGFDNEGEAPGIHDTGTGSEVGDPMI